MGARLLLNFMSPVKFSRVSRTVHEATILSDFRIINDSNGFLLFCDYQYCTVIKNVIRDDEVACHYSYNGCT